MRPKANPAAKQKRKNVVKDTAVVMPAVAKSREKKMNDFRAVVCKWEKVDGRRSKGSKTND